MPGAEIAGARTEWRAHPAPDAPPAILLHCSLAHSGAWAGVLQHLAGRLSMLAPDLPGHGGTGLVEDTTFLAQSLAILDALIDHQTGPVHLIGHSFGGVLAVRAARAWPERVASLTLIEPVLMALLEDADDPRFAAENTLRTRFTAHLEAGEMAEAAEAFLALCGMDARLDHLDPAQRDYIVERIHLIGAADEAIFAAGPGQVTPADLAALPMKMLLIGGAETPASITAVLDRIAAARPEAPRLTVAGAGHMAPISHPTPVAEAILAFLDEEAASAEARRAIPG
ncbi:MAG: alpha/beta fold hydrolase [Pseudomonadota bacterium]